MDSNPPTPPSAGGRRPRWWQRPSVMALGATVLLLGLAAGWSAWELRDGPGQPGRMGAATDAPAGGMPWQVQALGDGTSEVFGLRLGRTTLAEVSQRFERDLRVALVAPLGQPGTVPALEAYVETFQAGALQGRLVLAFDAEPDWLRRALERSPRDTVAGSGGARQHALSEDDRLQAQSLVLSALAFVPAARLDAPTVEARFGAPAERVVGPQGESQWLYPQRGLAIVLPPAEGDLARARAVLQYVAPREFDARLRDPLRRADRGG